MLFGGLFPFGPLEGSLGGKIRTFITFIPISHWLRSMVFLANQDRPEALCLPLRMGDLYWIDHIESLWKELYTSNWFHYSLHGWTQHWSWWIEKGCWWLREFPPWQCEFSENAFSSFFNVVFFLRWNYCVLSLSLSKFLLFMLSNILIFWVLLPFVVNCTISRTSEDSGSYATKEN